MKQNVCLALFIAVQVSPGFAQAAEDEKLSTLPEVVVKDGAEDDQGIQSNKTKVTPFGEKELKDTPNTITVINRELLDQQMAVTLSDAVKNDAGVTSISAPAGYYESVTIRGFTLDNWRNYKRDGLSFINQSTTPLENKERVEILKGLSGVFYGLASPSGIINYITKRPTRDAQYSILAEANQFGGSRIHVDASQAIGQNGEDHGVRLNLARQDLRTYVKGSEGERGFSSLAYQYRVSPDTRLLIEGDYEEARSEEGANSYGLLGGTTLPKVPDPELTLLQPWNHYRTRTWNLSAGLEQKLSSSWDLEVKVLKNRLYRDDVSSGVDTSSFQADGTYDFYEYRSLDETREVLSGQAGFHGIVETGPVVHELAVGYFQSEFKSRWGDGVYELLGQGNMFEPRKDLSPSGLPVPASRTTIKSTEEGIFASDSLSIGSLWGMQLSARQVQVNIQSFGADGSVESRYKKSHLSPAAALLFKPTGSITSYVSYLEGLEQGGSAASGANVVNAGEIMDPLVSEQLEAGIKLALKPGINFNWAIFQLDRGLEYNKDLGNGLVKYVQDGRQIHQGMELSVLGQVPGGVETIASLLFLDPKIKDSEDPALKNKRPTNVPKVRANLYANWNVPMVDGLAVNAGAFHTGKRSVDAANTVSISAFTRYDVGASYQVVSLSHPLTVRTLIENVGDLRYWNSTSWGSLQVGAPLTATVSAELQL
ncbi:MAG: TonB-dependent siderophore receptor [Pseudobdellovibrionaceae bacterium]|nr:TonB-dependent siderophore receptor [Pseudobdellovibrionaceae bacterium]